MFKAQNQEINLTRRTYMRHQPNTLSIEHKQLKDEIKILKQQNEKLKKRLEKMEDAMHQIYISKKKYKNRYKEVKQKLQILQQVYRNSSKSKNIYHKTSEYDQGKYNQDLHYQQPNPFLRQNPNTTNKKHDLTSNTMHMKQDVTSNTLPTMPSSRKSETKDFFRKNHQSRNLQQSNASNSRTKDAGKIFSFRSQQKQRPRYNSSGSQGEGDVNYRRQDQNTAYGYEILRQQKRQQRSPVSPSNYETTTQYLQQNEGSLRQLIENLISELHSFSKLQKEDQNLQKQIQIIATQQSLSHKLEEVCKKLQKIQTNQESLFVRISEHQQKVIQSSERHKGKKGANLTTGSGGKMNASFLKTIEDIGKDLSEWKIDYLSPRNQQKTLFFDK